MPGAIGPDVPVIGVTAVSDLADARAQLRNAFDFIAKPFHLNRVSELVAAANS